MSLAKGDHLVIKRGEHIVTPEDGEAYHEFEVMAYTHTSLGPNGRPIDESYQWKEGDVLAPGYTVLLKVLK